MEKETLLGYVKREISNIDIQRNKCLSEMSDGFNHAFEWSCCEELYCLNYKKSLLIRLMNVINETDDYKEVCSYLVNVIDTFEKEVKHGNFRKHSTNIYSNIAHTLKLEENMKLISLYERYCEYLTNVKDPIKLK